MEGEVPGVCGGDGVGHGTAGVLEHWRGNCGGKRRRRKVLFVSRGKQVRRITKLLFIRMYVILPA